MSDDRKPISYYGADNGMQVHIVDNDEFSISKGGKLEDTSLVEKYMMDDATYDAREKTVRRYKKEQLEKDPDWLKKREEAQRAPADLSAYVVGARCQVNPGGRRGEVKFIGILEGSEGAWIGVHLDEPQGLNDGSKDDRRYFECPPKYGCFARPSSVEVGDFPVEDPFACLDDSEDEI